MLHFIFQGNVYHTEDLMNSQTNQDFYFFLFFFFKFLAIHSFQVDTLYPGFFVGKQLHCGITSVVKTKTKCSF